MIKLAILAAALAASDFACAPTADPGGLALTFPSGAPGSTHVGQAVEIDRPENATVWTTSKATAASAAHVDGLAVAVGSDVTAQRDGVVSLTAAQWDAVTGQSGGLVRADRYYLSDVTEGSLLDGAPGAHGHYVTQIGVALSPTEMLLEIAPPVANP